MSNIKGMNNFKAKRKAVFLVSKEDPRLSMVAKEVPYKKSVFELADAMFKVMYDSNGVGLAAPQIGQSIRLIVVDYGIRMVIINPVITKKYAKITTSFKEGCLSYPGEFKNMQRHKRIVVEGFDEHWNPVRYDVRSTLSFVIQHEIDHLNGITIGNQ